MARICTLDVVCSAHRLPLTARGNWLATRLLNFGCYFLRRVKLPQVFIHTCLHLGHCWPWVQRTLKWEIKLWAGWSDSQLGAMTEIKFSSEGEILYANSPRAHVKNLTKKAHETVTHMELLLTSVFVLSAFLLTWGRTISGFLHHSWCICSGSLFCYWYANSIFAAPLSTPQARKNNIVLINYACAGVSRYPRASLVSQRLSAPRPPGSRQTNP